MLHRTRNESGFTLIEALVTLAIIGILIGAVLWSAQRNLAQRALNGSVRTIISDIATAKALAIKQNRVFRIVFTPGTNTTYQLQQETAPGSNAFQNYLAPVNIIPEATSASISITVATNYAAPAANTMELNPRGTLTSAGTITLTMPNGTTRQIATNLVGRTCVVEEVNNLALCAPL